MPSLVNYYDSDGDCAILRFGLSDMIFKYMEI